MPLVHNKFKEMIQYWEKVKKKSLGRIIIPNGFLQMVVKHGAVVE